MIRRSFGVKIMSGALGLALLSGCAGTKALGGANGEGLQVVDAKQLPPPNGIDISGDVRPYLLGPSDEILVDVVGIDELKERKFSLDGAGNVAVPLAGTLNASNQTAEQFAESLTQRLRQRYIRDPLVTVNLNEARSRFVTIDGQVGKPGPQPIVGRVTLMQSVARAEGTGEFAKLSDVVIFRTVGADQMVAMYDLGAIRRGAYADPEVFPGDIVVVGESRGRRMFQQIVQAGTLLVSPVVALIQRR
ncbi:MAG: polysaccharide biosynthesis/export family protein [Sphingopyxis sp.]|jgi:polysaccharide export outer membrane protein|uniref:polysaccharide biosynthesis/export family protein n=1 Tax=unclassified Sphingopyxis TaxID=2614943 RepID=UPI000731C5C6|nr:MULTISPECIES: polysaccharide biosynthesis/export family protein [unclassified Sphingopyxis]KTE01983.1 hypothetical protein ATE78_10845 [Sphingopyxis sp. H012]KTE09732.1 hypothetical protein ATE70_12860 [Sphingopyxis sp. H053]KTE15125.1 hypothetical protein ATE76_04315 [Sphingopyxis sp. H093]KTE29833.1 hypothetical protein ATE75_05310 [Sphingopyxis sp. H080]KTE32937.1 hypothetical protein ATE68_17570 [Sphingopyxis sp. H038]